jgi:uncharacterized protein
MARERPEPIVATMTGNRLLQYARQHPLLAFLVWFFPVAWAIAFIPFIAQRTIGLDLPLTPFLPLATLFGSTLPVFVLGDRKRLREQILKVKAHVGWYAIGLVAIPALSLALAVLLLGVPNVTPATWLDAIIMGFLVQTVVGFASTNLWEEVGWMGFFQARLQTSHGVIAAVVVTSLFFTLQHVPLMVVQDLPIFIPLVLFVIVVPFRALMAWIYNRTDSLFLAGLVHAAGDATVGGSLLGVGMLPRLYEGGDVALIGLLAQVLIGVVVIAATRAHLGMPARPGARVVPQPVAAS